MQLSLQKITNLVQTFSYQYIIQPMLRFIPACLLIEHVTVFAREHALRCDSPCGWGELLF